MKPKIKKRPWGKMEQFAFNEKCTVKILHVKSNKQNSLQTHKQRAEFWKVLEGPVKVVIGSKTIKAKANDQFFIKKGQKHRLGGYKKPGSVLEISFGNFKESDIKRLEDDFGRK
jgi:mannose-1-phosphate guanylyltransferase